MSAKNILTYDGSAMVPLFKEYIGTLKTATESLQEAFSDISEFQKPLDIEVLKSILNDSTSFFQDLDWKGQKWASDQRPMSQKAASTSAKKFVEKAQKEYYKWVKLYHSERPRINNTMVPSEILDLKNLSGLFLKDGFSDKWFTDQADKLNEYLESPLELEYWSAINDLAMAATKVASLAGHWAHKADPIRSFLTYDANKEVFSPIIDGLKSYVSVYGKVTENA